MCLWDFFSNKHEKDCGGYVFDHDKPMIISMTVALCFFKTAKIGDNIVLELREGRIKRQSICKILAMDMENSIIYAIPEREIIIAYNYLEIKRLLSSYLNPFSAFFKVHHFHFFSIFVSIFNRFQYRNFFLPIRFRFPTFYTTLSNLV